MKKGIQHYLFEEIFSRYAHRLTAVEDLRTLLNVGRSSVYNRINGSISLTLVEYEQLVTHYDISPDALQRTQNATEKVTFDYGPLLSSNQGNGAYLTRILSDLEQIKQDPKGEVVYLSPDVPLFYYFINAKVAWFKFYLYEKGQSHIHPSELPKIDFADEEEVFSKILKLYSLIPSEEIWTTRAFCLTISEIKYFVEADLFAQPEEALSLIDGLIDILKRMELIVNKNDKGWMNRKAESGARINLYLNDFNRFDTTILARTSRSDTFYVTFDIPHYLRTSNPEITAYANNWVQRVKQKSYKISGNADLVQLTYFNKLKKMIEKEKRIIEGMLHI